MSLSPETLTLLILAAAIALFLSNRLRPDLVALLALVALGAAGVLSPQDVFSGFSRAAVITIIAVFILAQGLQATGASEQLGIWLVERTGNSEPRLILAVMLAGAALSLFMNNIAAAAVLLPAVTGAARRKGVNPARLLMPLAFATILGGMATLFTTANIVVSGTLRQSNLDGFGVLDFAPVGVPVVAAGIAYMLLAGRHRLPARSAAERFAPPEPDLTDVYRLDERLFRARIPPGSALEGKPLAHSTFRETYNLNVVSVEHQGRTLLAPPPDTVLHAGDVLTLEGILEDFRAQDVEPYLEILPPHAFQERDLESSEIVVVESVLAPRGGLIRKTLRDVHFREKYGFVALAIWRAGRPIRRGLAALPLEFGDALLLQGPRARLPVLAAEPDLIFLSHGPASRAARPGRMWIAVLIMAAALVVAATNLLPTAEAMLAGSLLMVLTGCTTMDEAYVAIEWRAVFLVAGMLPMGLALSSTGLAAQFAGALVAVLGPYGPYALLAGLFLATTLLTQAINGSVVAAIVAPLAIQAASQTGASPRSLAMAVALASSMAFLTPLGHPVNVLVMGPGGYRFADFLKVGLPLALLVSAVVLLTLPLFWPL